MGLLVYVQFNAGNEIRTITVEYKYMTVDSMYQNVFVCIKILLFPDPIDY